MADTEEAILFRENFIHDVYRLSRLRFKPDVIFDLGANVGAFSCYAHHVFPDALIVAVEPNAKNFARLRENVEVHHKIPSDHIELLEAGLGSGRLWHVLGGKGGGQEVYVSEGPGYQIEDFAAGPGSRFEDASAVPCVTLRELVTKYIDGSVVPPSFIVKMDCEGGELTTLANDLDVLCRADYVAMEIHRYGATHAGKLQSDATIDAALARLAETHDCELDNVIFYATKRHAVGSEVVACGFADLPLSSITHRHQIFQWLNRTGRTGLAVEVGVAAGGHSSMILKEWAGKHLYMVDVWDAAHDYGTGKWQEWLENCQKLATANPGRATVVRKPSADASREFADDSLDFVFIDADHSYRAVKSDIESWWPKMKPGGLLAGHDYIECPSYGVIRAVGEFVAANGLPLTIVPVSDSDNPVWAVLKP